MRQDRPMAASAAAVRRWDASPLLPSIDTPTLILAANHPSIGFAGQARKLAAAIPDSRLQMVDGTYVPYAADRVAILEALSDLLQPDVRPQKPKLLDSDFRTIVFTDIVASTSFVGRVGDKAGRSAIRSVENIISEQASLHGGTIIKHLGDGSPIAFPSNTGALSISQSRSRALPPSLRSTSSSISRGSRPT